MIEISNLPILQRNVLLKNDVLDCRRSAYFDKENMISGLVKGKANIVPSNGSPEKKAFLANFQNPRIVSVIQSWSAKSNVRLIVANFNLELPDAPINAKHPGIDQVLEMKSGTK